MADIPPNTNQSLPKIINPLDEPLDIQPRKLNNAGQPSTNSVNQSKTSSSSISQDFVPSRPSTNQAGPPKSPPPPSSPPPMAKIFNSTPPRPAMSQTIPVGQFKLPPEELIAEEKQKISTIDPSNASSADIPSPNLSAKPLLFNQKQNISNSAPTINLKPKKKKRSLFKIILLIVIALLIISGVFIGLTYAGINIPYLSSIMTKILPISVKKDFNQSKALAQEAVNEANFYNISTKITIGQSSTDTNKVIEPPALPGLTIEDNADNQIIWKNMTMTIFGSYQSDSKTAGTISITPNTADASNVFQTSYDFVLDPNLLYLHPLGLFDENATNWQAIDRKEITNLKTAALLLDLLDLKKLLPLFEAGRWLAKEEVTITSQDNKDLGVIVADKYEISQNNIGNLTKNDLAIFLFLAENESHPVKMVATAKIKDKSGATIPVKIESYFFNYDVKQKVKIPAKEDYAIIALNQFLIKNGFYTDADTPILNNINQDSQIKKRDAIRKADLNNLAYALEKYFADKNAYPISSDTIKTNQLSALKDALVPDYLQSLPIDPLDPDYWYGYNSDGFTYHLTSIIEDALTSAKQGKNVRYQEVSK